MIKNYLKVALRNLLKNRVYSLINISGLAIGMTATILIALWIYDEISYNNYFEAKETIAQVFHSESNSNGTDTGPAVPRPLEFALRKDYSDNFKHIIMSSWNQPRFLKYGTKNINFYGNFMQDGAPTMLNLEIIYGQKEGLKELNSIMISQSTAKALFGNENPVGKIVKIDTESDMVVTGVYKDLPVNTEFHELEYLAPWKYYVSSRKWVQNAKTAWGNNSFQLYVQINDNTTMDAVTAKIKDVKKNLSADEAEFNPQLFLLPMKDWHLRSEFENGVQSGGRIENVWLFGIIGAFVLILACINFVNLSTARSEKRSLEVGIRKAVGSRKGQLIAQFLSESFVIVVLSFVIAIGFTLLFLNGFNELASKTIKFPWTHIGFWSTSVLFILFTSFLAGSYPALYLSSFHPVAVLKGTFKVGKNAALPRKILVVAQFTVSIALIIGTMVVINQIEFAKNRPTGYKEKGLIQVPVMSMEFLGKADLMRDQLIASKSVIEMATTSSPTTNVWSNVSGYTWEGKPPGFQEEFAVTSVSYEFVEALGLKLLKGRGFSRKFPTDSSSVIINKRAADYMGLRDPIGKNIRDGDGVNFSVSYKIIGVIDDMIMESPYSPVKPSIYFFDRENNANFYNLRLNPDRSVKDNIATVEKTFKANFPTIPFDYQFVDEQYGRKFRAEERVANLSKVFTLLAIFISCLGLFGLASFVAEQRVKEIGVRKTLGASVGQLWMLLSKDFVKLVLISLIIGSPIAYYMMTQWLQKFTYRTDISAVVFVIACLGAIGITLVTVSFQAIKSATSNPIESLRTE